MPHHPVRTSLNCIVTPGCPFGRPGFRPVFARSDLGAGFASPSDDGGFELFFEFCPAFAARSATCACSPATSSRKAATSASRSASNSRSRAFTIRRSGPASPGESGTTGTTPWQAADRK